MQKKWYRITTKQMCLMSLMVALHYVLGFFTVQATPLLRISVLPFMPIALIGMTVGPFAAAVTGAMGDIVNYLLITRYLGPYFPGYTFTAALAGVFYGLILYRKEIDWKKAAFCLAPVIVLCEMILNTLWTYMTASWGYFITNLPWRILANVIEFPIKILLLVWLSRMVKRVPQAYLKEL